MKMFFIRRDDHCVDTTEHSVDFSLCNALAFSVKGFPITKDRGLGLARNKKRGHGQRKICDFLKVTKIKQLYF